MAQAGMVSAQTSRLEALRARHAALTNHIESELQHTSADDLEVRQMKKQRLRLKEEIEGLREAS